MAEVSELMSLLKAYVETVDLERLVREGVKVRIIEVVVPGCAPTCRQGW